LEGAVAASNDSELPSEVVHELNELGFALTGGGHGNPSTYEFLRPAVGAHLHLTIEPVLGNRWRVAMRVNWTGGWREAPSPELPVLLSGLSPSSDGRTIEFSTEELLATLPRLLEESLLPMFDMGGG
jgi:hypothetical protein